MRKDRSAWMNDFPMEEEFEDYTGRMRAFVITCVEGGLGFTVRAEEKDQEGMGYELAVFSETSPYGALGRLRDKIRRALAVRHITGTPGAYRMLHDRLAGRITCDHSGNLALIVDGVALNLDDLGAVLASHEGWGFEMSIIDALE